MPVHVLHGLPFQFSLSLDFVAKLCLLAQMSHFFALSGLAEEFHLPFCLLVVQVLRILVEVSLNVELAIEDLAIVALLTHVT